MYTHARELDAAQPIARTITVNRRTSSHRKLLASEYTTCQFRRDIKEDFFQFMYNHQGAHLPSLVWTDPTGHCSFSSFSDRCGLRSHRTIRSTPASTPNTIRLQRAMNGIKFPSAHIIVSHKTHRANTIIDIRLKSPISVASVRFHAYVTP